MISAIQKEFQLHYGTDPAYVDFQPSSQHIISVLDEAEILQGPEHVQRRLARLYKLAHEEDWFSGTSTGCNLPDD